MSKLNIKNNKFIEIFIGLFIFLFYIWNVSKINSICEIPDEATYLFNASIFSKYDWRPLFSNLRGYYGVGYSLILAPLFFVCKSGKELIHGSLIINCVIVILIYISLIYIFCRICLFDRVKSSIVSGICCLCPFLITSTYKVICEDLLVLLVLLISIYIYRYSKFSSNYDLLILLFLNIYSYFTHARAVVICGISVVMVICITYKKKKTLFTFLMFFLSSLLWIVLSKYRDSILGILGTGKYVINDGTIVNQINGGFIKYLLSKFFSRNGIEDVFYQLIIKFVYLLYLSLGMIPLGIYGCVQECIYSQKNKVIEKNIFYLFWLLAFLGGFFAAIANSIGASSFNYLIYGRYYEYLTVFFIGYGVLSWDELKNEKYTNKILFLLIVTICVGGIAIISKSEDVINLAYMDTCRYDGFSNLVHIFNDWKEISVFFVSISIVAIILLVLDKVSQNKYFLMIPLVLCLFMMNNAFVIRDHIINRSIVLEDNWSNMKVISDTTKKDIKFLNEDYKYESYYLQLQPIIYKQPIELIVAEDLMECKEDIVITYSNSSYKDELDTYFVNCVTGSRYDLYYN